MTYHFNQPVLYLIKSPIGVKIGVSNDFRSRLQSLQAQTGCELGVIDVVKMPSMAEARQLEKKLHNWLDHLRLKGEWFRADPIIAKYGGISLECKTLIWGDGGFHLDVIN